MHQYIFIFKNERVYKVFKHIHSIFKLERPIKGYLIYIYIYIIIYVHHRALLVNIKFICTRIPHRRGALDTTLYDEVCQ